MNPAWSRNVVGKNTILFFVRPENKVHPTPFATGQHEVFSADVGYAISIYILMPTIKWGRDGGVGDGTAETYSGNLYGNTAGKSFPKQTL
jgi:hypothetical protein